MKNENPGKPCRGFPELTALSDSLKLSHLFQLREDEEPHENQRRTEKHLQNEICLIGRGGEVEWYGRKSESSKQRANSEKISQNQK